MAAMLRVLVLSADVGEGHLAAARAIAEGLEQRDVEVVERDGLIALGHVARHVIRDGYRLQLRLAPWSYQVMYTLFNRLAISRRAGEVILSRLGRRRLLRLVAETAPDIVVSTHPALTAVLGRARRRRRLDVPLVAPITDMADYVVWSHRGADVHLVMHEHAIGAVEDHAGAGSAVLVSPLVAQRFRAVRDAPAARRELGLPEDGTVVAVSGGGWGVGDLAGGTETALACGAGAVVVVAGRNDAAERALRRRFAGDDRVTVLGFTQQMDTLMRAADVLIHSTGGVTSLEALACGCPMIAYGASAGHIRVHNATMASLGLIAVADTRAQLRELLGRQLASPAAVLLAPPSATADAAAAIMGARHRVRPLPAWRLALASAAAPLVAVALTYAGLATDEAYSVAARPFELRPTTHVATARPDVAVVVRGAGADAPVVARLLARSGTKVTFAVVPAAVAWVAPSLEARGDDLVPALPPAAPIHWLRTRGTIRHAPLLDGRHAYLAPDDGLTFGQYLVARAAGATAVAGRIRYLGSAAPPSGSAVAGDIVVLTADGPPTRTAAEVRALATALSGRGLRAVTLSVLLAPSSVATSDRTAGDPSSASAPATTTTSPATTASG
jgi:UDP-N-acetylglucosamine:LPS N-acetylglucosamine transferase